MANSVNLLDRVYSDLKYTQGDLVRINQDSINPQRHIDIGQWMDSCKRINGKSKTFCVDALFFVKNNPVIVFGVCQSVDSMEIDNAYINVWNFARPKYFFLSAPGELRLYDLFSPLSKTGGKINIPKPIELITTANDILKKLAMLSRGNIEAGNVELDTGSRNYRADRTLINDIKRIRTDLIELGLNGNNLKYAHSLIGRSIFIRYLEDRGILTDEYFSMVASQSEVWEKVLVTPIEEYAVSETETNANYMKALRDKSFTYALFRKLSLDFNGDMFPIDEQEENAVTAEHLIRISGFLQGKFDEQMRLFFWAYRFDVIPMELMSNLYEMFYHKENENDNAGTHYTPLSLAEFVIEQALPWSVLESDPKILDPCCGSGVFIVEAFKRIVRYNTLKNNGTLLGYEQLKKILKNQIFAIERNEAALRIAAFSLYIAFLDSQEPPCILEHIKNGKLLPNLKHNEADASYNTLLCADAFSEETSAFIAEESFDVVIGNPPWGKADAIALKWCEKNELPLGDKEYSQAFIWRTMRWAKDNGAICFLLPTGIFSKSSDNNNLFKEKWLSSVELCQIVNFAHSRTIFFQKSIAPFMSVLYRVNKPHGNTYVSYWSVKQCSMNIAHQYIVLSKSDMHFIKQDQFLQQGYAWKTLLWGGLADLSLIGKLKVNKSLDSLVDEGTVLIKQGYTPGKGKTACIDKLSAYRKLSLKDLVSYGDVDKYLTDDVPKEVKYNFGSFEIFEGDRILVKSGISRRGEIIARIEYSPFSYTNDVHCIKFINEHPELMKTIGAILLSSLAKYYFFLTCDRWGLWYDSILLEELKHFPLPDSFTRDDTEKLCVLMDEVKRYEDMTLESPTPPNERSFDEIIKDIDRIVFDMYKLTEDEKSLITDMCSYGLDLYYNKAYSYALKPLQPILSPRYGTEKSLQGKSCIIYDYIGKIISVLNNHLASINAELEWRIHRSKGIIAIVLLTKYVNDPTGNDAEDENDWEAALAEFKEISKQKVTTDIYFDRAFVGVSENCIVIAKRDEFRQWSSSAAIRDISSILLKLIGNQSMEVGENE